LAQSWISSFLTPIFEEIWHIQKSIIFQTNIFNE
jgi:hypothetical protein